MVQIIHVNIVDINGDSLSISKFTNAEDVMLAIFNGLQDGTDVTMKWNNGILDPTSIEQQVRNTSDFFCRIYMRLLRIGKWLNCL